MKLRNKTEQRLPSGNVVTSKTGSAHKCSYLASAVSFELGLSYTGILACGAINSCEPCRSHFLGRRIEHFLSLDHGRIYEYRISDSDTQKARNKLAAFLKMIRRADGQRIRIQKSINSWIVFANVRVNPCFKGTFGGASEYLRDWICELVGKITFRKKFGRVITFSREWAMPQKNSSFGLVKVYAGTKKDEHLDRVADRLTATGDKVKRNHCSTTVEATETLDGKGGLYTVNGTLGNVAQKDASGNRVVGEVDPSDLAWMAGAKTGSVLGCQRNEEDDSQKVAIPTIVCYSDSPSLSASPSATTHPADVEAVKGNAHCRLPLRKTNSDIGLESQNGGDRVKPPDGVGNDEISLDGLVRLISKRRTE